MEYYFSKTISGSFDNAIQKVTDALKAESFGILTEIDIKATLKKKHESKHEGNGSFKNEL